jgi:HrpA-like RNA helicase
MAPPITLLKPGCLVARMGESQSELDKLVPINYIMDWFDKRIRSGNSAGNKKVTMSDRVVVLLSKTGSGKSTSIAPNLYLRFFNRYRKQIVITQPRVLTAIEIPKDISKIPTYQTPNKEGLSLELFKNLGYQTQDFVRKPAEKGILFTTTGILLQYLKTMTDEIFIRKYKFIIIDEAHDRSIDVDLVLFMMRELLTRNLGNDPPFLILMSATLNVQEYCRYFNTKTVFEVSGQSKPIQVHYPEHDIEDIYQDTIGILEKIAEREDKETDKDVLEMLNKGIRDVIIFMPNTSYIVKMTRAIEAVSMKMKKKIFTVPITSADIESNSKNYQALIANLFDLKFPDGSKPYRRVIISTNVAETGLTLESLRYCIDTGLLFVSEYNPRLDASMRMVKPTTSSMSLQRKGRVGRKFPGVFYPLFTEESFNHMVVDNIPSIMVEDITAHLLAIMLKNSKEPKRNVSVHEIPLHALLSPPSNDAIQQAIESLFVYGAIDSHGMITELGKIMGVFRKLSLQSVRMILSAPVFGVSMRDMIIMAIMIEAKKSDYILRTAKAPVTSANIIMDIYGVSNECDIPNYSRLKNKLLIGCDFLEGLLLYHWFIQQFKTKDVLQVRDWCDKNHMNFYFFISLGEQVDNFMWLLLNEHNINPTYHQKNLYETLTNSLDSPTDDEELVEIVCKYKECIYSGFKKNILIWDNDRQSYVNRYGEDIIVSNPIASQLSYQKIGAPFKQNKPNILLYKNMVLKKHTKSGNYIWEPDLISNMDGFVKVDIDLLQS